MKRPLKTATSIIWCKISLYFRSTWVYHWHNYNTNFWRPWNYDNIYKIWNEKTLLCALKTYTSYLTTRFISKLTELPWFTSGVCDNTYIYGWPWDYFSSNVGRSCPKVVTLSRWFVCACQDWFSWVCSAIS